MICYAKFPCIKYAGKDLPDGTRECKKPLNMNCYHEEHPWLKTERVKQKKAENQSKTAMQIALEKAKFK